MNHVLAELLQTGVVVSGSGKTHKVHSHIPFQERCFLQEILSGIRPSVSLEVGLGYGVSTLFICEALAHFRIPTLSSILITFNLAQHIYPLTVWAWRV